MELKEWFMESTSASDGSSNINLYFETGYDLNIAAIDVTK